MRTLEQILSDPWRLEPSVAIGVLILTGLYLWAWRQRRAFGETGPVDSGQVAWFLTAMALMLLALHPIVDELADRYSFSVHMGQHLVLSLVMPIPLLLGTPAWLLRPLTRVGWLDALARRITFPVVAFGLFSAYFALLHVPRFYDTMLNDRAVHIASHLFIMASSVIMFWPVFGPLPEWRGMGYGLQMLYLFGLTIPQSIVGALITYSPDVLYQTYLRAPRILPWSPLDDQQFAGLLMWVGGMTYTLLILTIVFFRWAAHDTADDVLAEATVSAEGR